MQPLSILIKGEVSKPLAVEGFVFLTHSVLISVDNTPDYYLRLNVGFSSNMNVHVGCVLKKKKNTN